MKQFFTYVLASIVGRVISAFIGFGILALLVLVFSLTGGGNDTSGSEIPSGLSKAGVTIAPQQPVETSQEPVETTPAGRNATRPALIEQVRSDGVVADKTDEEIWQLALDTCNKLDAGHPWTAYVKSDDPEVQVLQKDAVKVVCPFHQNSVDFG